MNDKDLVKFKEYLLKKGFVAYAPTIYSNRLFSVFFYKNGSCSMSFEHKSIKSAVYSSQIAYEDLPSEPEQIMQVLLQSLVTESDKVHSILQNEIRGIL